MATTAIGATHLLRVIAPTVTLSMTKSAVAMPKALATVCRDSLVDIAHLIELASSLSRVDHQIFDAVERTTLVGHCQSLPVMFGIALVFAKRRGRIFLFPSALFQRLSKSTD